MQCRNINKDLFHTVYANAKTNDGITLMPAIQSCLL